jgi:hypothetical protein
MRERSRIFEWLGAAAACALAALCAQGAARPKDAEVEAAIRFPGDARTAAVVYARNLETGALTTAHIEAGQPKFVIRLPAGRYWLFAEPDDPGAPDLLGAYTEWSRCRAASPANGSAACDSHALAEVEVGRDRVEGLQIDDWIMPANVVHQLDLALNRNPDRPDDLELGAPRFSEYPAHARAPDAPFRFDPTAHPEAGHWESAARTAAARGVNFAGHWLLVPVGCTEDCASYVLIEWSTGRIFAPDALRAVKTRLPCERAQPVQHRADSRLLTVTQANERSVVTRYYVWDETQGSLTEIASYTSSVQRYCGRG